MNKNRRKILILLLALAAYGLLLGLLVWAESGQSGDPIDSLPEALWYSLVTLSTVGYGDLYPRTPVGRLVGIVLLLMSTGLLALVIGAVAASLTNRLLPGLRLWFNRRRWWYVFSTGNSASRALAGHLDDGFVVYCRSEGSRQLADGLALWEDPGALFARPVAHAGERLFFAMDADAMANEADAEARAGTPEGRYKHEMTVNKSLAIGILKDELIRLVLAGDSEREGMMSAIVAELGRNLVPVRRKRSYSREGVNKNRANRYSNTHKRVF